MSQIFYGGQAVIEGVMMRGKHQATVVVRSRSGDLISHSEQLPPALYQGRIGRLPFVRGLVVLWEMLVFGTRMMLFSLNVQSRATLEREISSRTVGTMLAISLTFAIGLFFVIPLVLTRASNHVVHGTLVSNATEGLIRLTLLLGYLFLIGRMAQMQRVFEYHGAEHKTVNAFEHGAELTPECVQKFSLIHVRCGTAFLLWVLLISIFVFALLGHPPILIGILARVILVPLIATTSYEILRLGARYYRLAPVRWVLQPGLWLQRLTTREPSLEQIEVAIAAFQPVLMADLVASGLHRPAMSAAAV